MIQILIACLFILFLVFILMGGIFILFIRMGLFDIKGSPDAITWEEFKLFIKKLFNAQK